MGVIVNVSIVGWSETQDNYPQCKYKAWVFNGPDLGDFLVRLMDDMGYKWSAINLNMPKLGAGQIFASGQSDTDCLHNAVEQLEKFYEKKLG